MLGEQSAMLAAHRRASLLDLHAIRYGSVLRVARRIRVVPGRDRIRVADLAILAVDYNLSPAGVVHDFASAIVSFRLRISVCARALSTGSNDAPTAARIRHNMPIIRIRHQLLRLSVISERMFVYQNSNWT
jgi:hypothetical protein